MTKDPYRELAQKTRVEIQRVKREAKEQPTEQPIEESPSRMERKEEKKQKQYPLLKVLLVFFITLPFITLFWYSYTKDRDDSSTTVVTEEANPSTPLYETEEDKKETEQQAGENKETDSGSEEKEKSAEPAREAIASTVETAPEKVSERPEEKPEPKLEPKPVPKPEPVPKPKPEPKQEPKPEGKVVYHTVKPQETVFRISMTYYNSQSGIEKIRQANNLNGNDIKVGQVLKIPLP